MDNGIFGKIMLKFGKSLLHCDDNLQKNNWCLTCMPRIFVGKWFCSVRAEPVESKYKRTWTLHEISSELFFTIHLAKRLRMPRGCNLYRIKSCWCSKHVSHTDMISFIRGNIRNLIGICTINNRDSNDSTTFFCLFWLQSNVSISTNDDIYFNPQRFFLFISSRGVHNCLEVCLTECKWATNWFVWLSPP